MLYIQTTRFHMLNCCIQRRTEHLEILLGIPRGMLWR